MSLINNSALSCVATAVGCALTGIAVSEHLDQPNPVGPIRLGIQQNPVMDAEDLMAAASDGIEKSVVPPLQMFSPELTPTARADNFLTFTPKQPEIWQQSPLDIGNLVATAPTVPQTPQLNFEPTENVSNDFFPDYLNFDDEGAAPEAIEVATEDFSESEFIDEPISVSALPPRLEPVPPPPQLVEPESRVAQYVVEPEAVVRSNVASNNLGESFSQSQVSARSMGNPRVAQYIVEPQGMTRVATQPQRLRNNSQRSASQYVVEPQQMMAAPASVPPQNMASRDSSAQTASQYVVEPQQMMAAPPRMSPQSMASTLVSRTSSSRANSSSAINPRPKLLQKLVEPYQLPSETIEKDRASPTSSSLEESQGNLERVNHSIRKDEKLNVAVQAEIDESDEDLEEMPSLLRNLVRSYNRSSDVLHDIKVSPSPLETSKSKLAQN
ncbi:MAG: hypothetical protein SWJ54_00415 [Cyanobacteriota bacterium]|nr:hypothetical protein [Cyanobacteriota bacterium]